MDDTIRSCADNNDLKSLKYIFVDALEADPTFVRYEEEYGYCKSIPGLLEPHQELTPFSQDQRDWDETYWSNLKIDLLKNFSDCRMMHMKEVAQIFHAEKIERILNERAVEASLANPEPVEPVSRSATPAAPMNNGPKISKAEWERRKLEEAQRALAEENRREEALRQEESKRIEDLQRTCLNSGNYDRRSDRIKKALGIATVVLAVMAIVLILILQ
jgi:hypothetical protein